MVDYVVPGMIDSTAGSLGFRNRIINGGMQIWQRGTSSTAATYSYIADRWAFGNFVNTTASQSTSVPTGFQYSLKVQRPASATSTTPILAMQTIESLNCYDLAGQTVTVSFYAKAGANFSASASIFGIQLWTGTVADQGGSTYSSWTGPAQPINTQVTLTTTWQRFTLTGTIGSGVLEMAPVFYYTPVGTAGADDAFYITGVQLEVGSIATPFERRPYGTELALCQRYYQTFYPGQVGWESFKLWDRAVPVIWSPMRATPTAALFGTPTYNTVNSATLAPRGTNSGFIIFGMGGSDGVWYDKNVVFGTTSGFTLSAEL